MSRTMLALVAVLLVAPRAFAQAPLPWSQVAATTPATNLILITLDTTRRDHLSCYGYASKTTPNLDAIADEGIVFEKAYSPVPLTGPSHCTMLTGLYPFQHGVRHNGVYVLADSFKTLAELLKTKGYDTGAVVAGFPVDHRFGMSQGFDQYDDHFPPAPGGADQESAERPAGDVTRLSLEWLAKHTQRPFFFWAHYYDPHAPYTPPEPFKSRYADKPYDGEIAYVDSEVAKLIAGLKAKGLLERTILIIAGDHGEGLGEHNQPTHSMFIYGSTQNVPLMVRFPNRAPWTGPTWHHRRLTMPASLTDIYPAAWNALGFAQSEMPPVAGRSLLPMMEGKDNGHDWLYYETLVPDLDFGMSDLRGLQIGPWKYIRAPKPEMYQIEQDPGELKNLADKEKDRMKSMETQLAGILKSEKASGTVAMNKETLDKLRSLGYLQGGPAAKTEVERADPKDLTGVANTTARTQAMSDAGHTVEAIAVLDSLLQVRPQTRAALRLRARFLLKLDRGRDAIRAYEKALADCAGCPDQFTLLKEEAKAFLSAGRPDDALKQTNDLLSARPDEQGLNMQLGEILEAKSDFPGAKKAYAREAELYPQDVQPFIRLGKLEAGQNRAAGAEQYYRKAIAANPSNVEALTLLADLLDRGGNHKEAADDIDRALNVDPNSPVAHYCKAWILRRAGKKEESLPDFELAAKGQPTNGQLLYDLGSLYAELGRQREAVDAYERAVKTPNAPAGAYSNLGVRAAQSGHLDDAIKLWQQALEKHPSPQEATVIQNNLRRAQDMKRGGAGGN